MAIQRYKSNNHTHTQCIHKNHTDTSFSHPLMFNGDRFDEIENALDIPMIGTIKLIANISLLNISIVAKLPFYSPFYFSLSQIEAAAHFELIMNCALQLS